MSCESWRVTVPVKKPSRSEREHHASAYGSDADFRAWIQTQPSCISGTFSEYVDGQGRCIAAHVRRVGGGAGVGQKPPFSCLPLTDQEHRLQHAHGEQYFGKPSGWWEETADRYLKCWVRTRYTTEDERDFRD